ncbi:MAG: Bug family tripartite tricarboxylate transporter substrate binding protein [Candidatus Binatia bacterium]
MLKRLKFFLVAVVGITLSAVVAFTAAAEEFYKGKTITFVVGFSAGGGFDTYTRLIARHFGKHVPGNPTTVVQNRTGAGSLIAANYIYNKAKPDGTVIGNWIGPLVLQQVMGNPAVKLDGRKLGWLGIPTPDSGVCALTKASGIKSVDDWFASKRPIKIGGTGPGSSTDDGPKILKVAIGLPIRVIEGYKGTAKIRLAAEAGEIDGGCWAWQSVKVTWRKAVESGNVRVVLQLMLESHPELKDVPLAINYAKTAEARELLNVLANAYGATVRPYSVPPGTPKDRLRILQKAFMDTLRDPELLKEAKKSRLEIDPTDGPTAAKLFAAMYDMKPALLSRLKEIIVPKKR